MRYIFELTVPANTLAADPAQLEISLVKGKLEHVEIAFPPGPASMVHVIIKEGLLQVSPANQGGSHHWDHYTEIFSLNYPLTDNPSKLQLVGWSPDTKYSHIVTFRLDVAPKAKDDRSAIMEFIFGKR